MRRGDARAATRTAAHHRRQRSAAVTSLTADQKFFVATRELEAIRDEIGMKKGRGGEGKRGGNEGEGERREERGERREERGRGREGEREMVRR